MKLRLPRWTVYPALVVLIGLPMAFVPRLWRDPHEGAALGELRGELLRPEGQPARAGQVADERWPRVVVLGIDGLDPDLLAEVVARHPERTQNFRWLIDAQGLHSLITSTPPQSPVAWSNFITGLDPGGHGVFDFIHRDPLTRMPATSTTREQPPGVAARALAKVPLPGAWVMPAAGSIESNRSGEAFWSILKKAGVPADIWRMPANFPVIPSKGLSFSGMMTPALDSAYGECTLYTTDVTRLGEYHKLVVVSEKGGRIDTRLSGPANSFKAPGSAGEVSAATLAIHVDRLASALVIEGGSKPLVMKPGQWSDFARFDFELLPAGLSNLSGIARFYLRSIEPEIEIYASPVNIDPLSPAMDVSAPSNASAELAEEIGLFYTQGMAEDVNALKRRLLNEDEFMRQVELVHEESRRMLAVALERYLERRSGGFLFFYFSTVDLTSHMMWRLTDPSHPAFDAKLAARTSEWWSARPGSSWKDTLDDLVLKMDPVLGELRAKLGEGATYIVMSDHGFAPYERCFSLNTWLLEHGYLVLREGCAKELAREDEGFRERHVFDVLRAMAEFDGTIASVQPTAMGGRTLVLRSGEGTEHVTIVPAAAELLVEPGEHVTKGQALSTPYTLVDWTKTRAYGIGFQSLYLNLKGREGNLPETAADESGTVGPGDAKTLLLELKRELEALRDPKNGARPVLRCDLSSEVYTGERMEEAPDLVVGYNSGYGNSDQATEGRIPREVLWDNLGGSFNGSHLMAPDVVSGTLLSNRALRPGAHRLEDLTVEVLRQFGLLPGVGMQGHAVLE